MPVDPPRVRYAKTQLAALAEAVERVDRDQLNAYMQVIELEDRLADAQEQAARWRRSYEALRVVMAHTGSHIADMTVLDKAMREWVGKA